jgi:hypothetical protein
MGFAEDPGHGDVLRRALLQRIANGLAVARKLHEQPELGGCWPCCWVPFERGGVRFLHNICADGCPHWHHQTEIFLA